MAKFNPRAFYPTPGEKSKELKKWAEKKEKAETSLRTKKRLLSISIVILISFILMYVLYSVIQSNRALDNAEKVSQNASFVLKNPGLRKHGYPMFQWGVRGVYTGTMKLKYAINDNGHQRAFFSSDELVAADTLCNIESGAGGYIDKYAKGEKVTLKDGTTKTIEAYIASGQAGLYSHVGKYYYVASQSKIICKESAVSQRLQSEVYGDVQSIAKSFVSYCSVQICGDTAP